MTIGTVGQLSERLFDTLFEGVSTRFGLRNVEKCVEETFRNLCPTFQAQQRCVIATSDDSDTAIDLRTRP